MAYGTTPGFRVVRWELANLLACLAFRWVLITDYEARVTG
jgi:hypothetical protein